MECTIRVHSWSGYKQVGKTQRSLELHLAHTISNCRFSSEPHKIASASFPLVNYPAWFNGKEVWTCACVDSPPLTVRPFTRCAITNRCISFQRGSASLCTECSGQYTMTRRYSILNARHSMPLKYPGFNCPFVHLVVKSLWFVRPSKKTAPAMSSLNKAFVNYFNWHRPLRVHFYVAAVLYVNEFQTIFTPHGHLPMKFVR